MANLNPAPRHDRCDHPLHLREQRYPHGWFCGGCCRFFFGSASDAVPQIMPPEDRERARLHREERERVGKLLLACGVGLR